MREVFGFKDASYQGSGVLKNFQNLFRQLRLIKLRHLPEPHSTYKLRPAEFYAPHPMNLSTILIPAPPTPKDERVNLITKSLGDASHTNV